jgi:AbrB family looped-hinge helix DNA binding protein
MNQPLQSVMRAVLPDTRESGSAELADGLGNGRFNGMKTTIDAAGRLVIPQEIRREAGLKPGTPLDVRWRDGRIEIEPAPLAVKLVRKGRLLVAVPQGQVGPLRVETVERTRRRLQRERGADE